MRPGKPMFVQNIKTGEVKHFKSIKETAAFFGVTAQTIFQYFENGKPYKKTWCFDYPLETEVKAND